MKTNEILLDGFDLPSTRQIGSTAPTKTITKTTVTRSPKKKQRTAEVVDRIEVKTAAIADNIVETYSTAADDFSTITPEALNTFYKKPKRVAAYCRVSTLMEEQELSYESQCAYYENLIGNTPGLTLVAVYGDQGFSGLHAKKRPQFMKLVQDAREGKMEISTANLIQCIKGQYNFTI